MTAGLGGMSGAQAKAAVICGCVGVIAEVVVAVVVVFVVVVVVVASVDRFMKNVYFSEVSREALEKRHKQGWVVEVVDK